MELVYASDKVKTQCTSVKAAKKLFGGDAVLAASLLARINALEKIMSNYIEYDDKIAFHPGYYIKEIVEESGLTQEDFAKRLDTTPKNLSLLIRGEQSLSIDIAMKLFGMIGTSVSYWLNLQNAFDALIAEFKFREHLQNR